MLSGNQKTFVILVFMIEKSFINIQITVITIMVIKELMSKPLKRRVDTAQEALVSCVGIEQALKGEGGK